jgi:peptide/nickel transport system substrate-binding protein
MLAEWVIAGKAAAMRRFLPILLIAMFAVVPAACRQQSEGAVRVTVIGDPPKMADPAKGSLTTPDAVLLENVAQGLVRFDANGNIVGGLAERWNVSDDGLSYIFRIASASWPDGKKITAEEVAKILKREIGPRSRDELKDPLGAVDDIVAMTDRVIEIRLLAPRPNLLALLAQPDLAIIQRGVGTGPFTAAVADKVAGELRLTRNVASPDEEATTKEEVMLSGTPAQQAVQSFVSDNTELVLGGTFADLSFAARVKVPRGSLQFDPASGLFGLLPVRTDNHLDDPGVRRMLSQAIDRDAIIAALGVPALTPRATLLEPGLDQLPPPTVPAWLGTPLADRLGALRAQADRTFGKDKPTLSIALPQGPGADLLLSIIGRSWGALGFTVERAADASSADFVLVDQVAPAASAAWFVRQFRCEVAVICDSDTDKLVDAARQTPVPQQRYALLQQAAGRIDDEQLFLPITAPVRWSLVGRRVQGFAGNRFAVHTLTDLQQRPGSGG